MEKPAPSFKRLPLPLNYCILLEKSNQSYLHFIMVSFNKSETIRGIK